MTSRLAPRLLAAIALAFVAAALFHAAALLYPPLDRSSPAWRHALFIAINLVAAAGLVRRPRGFGFAFAVLTAQQLASHGGAALRAWRDAHRIDVASLAVLVVMPIALAALVRTSRRHHAPHAP